MDTSDPGIRFNTEGVCNHCETFKLTTQKEWFPNQEGAKHLATIIDKIRLDGRSAEYDCILGLSGGVDSSYLALKAKGWGLRPLVVHVDAGWNSELAVANIEKIVKHCQYDLHTHVVDWEDMRDLHLAYMRSGLSNQDVPQDHIFFSSLYHYATKNNIRYILSGGNIATEGIIALGWHGGSAMDSISLKAVHERYGERALKNYHTISFWQYYIWFPFIKKMRTVRPLNFIPYNKEIAIQELELACGWRSYGRKHGESLFTKVFQNDFLPRKYGYDKRLPHLSSLIVSGQISRADAIKALDEPLYDPFELGNDLDYFCKKLRINRDQYEAFILGDHKDYEEFPNWTGRYRVLKSVQRFVEGLIGRRMNIYS
jgi:N-acetyl sugar amidotransferase